MDAKRCQNKIQIKNAKHVNHMDKQNLGELISF